MTIPDLKQFTRLALEAGLSELKETGTVQLQFWLFRPTGAHEVVLLGNPAVANDPNMKKVVDMFLRERIQKEGIVAVVLMSDVWLGAGTRKSIPELNRLGIEAGAEKGLCTKQEAILVTLESPIYCSRLALTYQREADAGNEPDKIVPDTEPIDLSENDYSAEGRLCNFFPPVTGPTQ